MCVSLEEMLEELGEKKMNLFLFGVREKKPVEIHGDYCLHIF
jgi:hypothetical protein